MENKTLGIAHIHIHSSPASSSLSRVGLVSSIYPLVCASSLSSSYISFTFYVSVLVLIVPSPHCFIVFFRLNSLRLSVCCCLTQPWACFLLNNPIPLFRILIIIPRIPLTVQHTNKPAPLVSLLETYLSFVLFFFSPLSLFLSFFGCCYSYHCLSPAVQYFRLLSPFSLCLLSSF